MSASVDGLYNNNNNNNNVTEADTRYNNLGGDENAEHYHGSPMNDDDGDDDYEDDNNNTLEGSRGTRRSCPSTARHLLRQLRETANPTTLHTTHLTAEELVKQASFESLDYYKPYPNMYMDRLRSRFRHRKRKRDETHLRMHGPSDGGTAGGSAQLTVDVCDPYSSSSPAAITAATLSSSGVIERVSLASLAHDEEERHVALRWLLHVLIAISVGVVATVVAYGVEVLEGFRTETLNAIMTDAPFRIVGYFGGLFFCVAFAVLFVAVATSVVVFVEPCAAGGGIPDVMAYLNGVHMRGAMGIRTFVVKAISCVCAVASGLPVGLEAPLIHLGAITGAGVTQGRSRTLGIQTSLFKAFRNNKDRRDFITAGAACGVSAAFGAPIGGLLFVMEEVSSFWDHSASGQIFLATMITFTVTTVINSVVEGHKLLGWVSNAVSVLFEVNLTIPLNLISILPSLLLGALLGSWAALFTKVNLMLIKWRRKHLRPYPWRRVAEPIVIVAVFTTVTYSISLMGFCVPIKPIEDIEVALNMTTHGDSSSFSSIFAGEEEEDGGGAEGGNVTVHVWGTEEQSRLFNATCGVAGTYSPLATLHMATGKNLIRHLFTRQTIAQFSAHHLFVYFIVYSVFACWSSGAALSGGLVVPSLVIGAILGRLYGLLLWYIGSHSVLGVERGYLLSDAWMDPGVFALIGAGAFLAGTSRLAMSICVIMVELSSELRYLLPVMVAIAMSKTVADWLSEPLYHEMLHLDSVPYLPAKLPLPEFEQLTAADVMAPRVVLLRRRERTEVVLDALRNTTHHAFPVVEMVDNNYEQRHPQQNSTQTAEANGDGHHHDDDGYATRSSSQPRREGAAGAGATAHVSLDMCHFKFVGLVTREDLEIYFSLPALRMTTSFPSPSPTSSPSHNGLEAATATSGRAAVTLLADGDSDGFGGRLSPGVLKVNRMTWAEWVAHKNSLFLRSVDKRDGHTSDSPPSLHATDVVVVVEGSGATAAAEAPGPLPPVVDLSLIVNRSPWVIPPFFNLQMAYHTFRMMGLRHMVVVDGDVVCGMITRKDLLVDTLRRRMRDVEGNADGVVGARSSNTGSSGGGGGGISREGPDHTSWTTRSQNQSWTNPGAKHDHYLDSPSVVHVMPQSVPPESVTASPTAAVVVPISSSSSPQYNGLVEGLGDSGGSRLPDATEASLLGRTTTGSPITSTLYHSSTASTILDDLFGSSAPSSVAASAPITTAR